MAISNDLQVAAKELGAALGANPVVKEYLLAREELAQDTDLQRLEGKIEQVYQELVTRQQNGEVLLPGEINVFYDLREKYTNHPLVVRYSRCESAIKALFSETGSTLSSILSVEYTQLVS